MKKISILIGLCMIMMFVACGTKTQEGNEAANITQAQPEGESIEVYGEVVVEHKKEIVIDFPAIIEEINVKDGQEVKKGEPLITLNFDEYQSMIQTKEDEIKLYELQLQRLEQSRNPLNVEVGRLQQELQVKRNYLEKEADPDIIVLQRELEVATDITNQARKDYEVHKEMLEIGAISERQLEDLEKTVGLKEKEINNIMTNIEKLRTAKQLEISTLTSQLQSIQMQLSNTDKEQIFSIEDLKIRMNIAKQEVETMRNKINKSYMNGNTIVADKDQQVVYDIACMEGSRVGELTGPIIKLMDLHTIILTIDIPEEYIGGIEVGSEVEAELYMQNMQNIVKGKITRIAHRAIEKNGETIIQADVCVDKGREMLKPGLSVDARIYK